VHVEDQASRAIYVRLRDRARVLRGLGICFVVLIPLTLAFGTIPYFLAGDTAIGEARAALEMRRFQVQYQAAGVEKQDRIAGEPASGRGEAEASDSPTVATGGGGALPEQPPAARAAAPPPQAQRPAEPALTAWPRDSLQISDVAFSAAVIRITTAVLLLALVYVFGSLYRYSMRLAWYYDEKADALRLLEAGDRQLEERLSQITLASAGPDAPARSGGRT
jgi:hypothetical protein